jgi:hypothetical protein
MTDYLNLPGTPECKPAQVVYADEASLKTQEETTNE